MEEVEVIFSDTGLVATATVTAEIAEKMRNDPVYASDVIAQLAASTVESGDDLCASPLRKKVCAVRTPDPQVLKPARNGVVCSTPKTCSKSLAFKSSYLKMSNLPDPFLESNFIRGLEKSRKKKGISTNLPNVIKGITNYDRSAGTAVIELVSKEVATAFVNELGSYKSFRSQNTLVFQEMDDESNVNVYADDTLLDVEADFQPLTDDGSSDEYQPDLSNTSIPFEIDGKSDELRMSNVDVAIDFNGNLSQPDLLNTSNSFEIDGKSDEVKVDTKVNVVGLPSTFDEKAVKHLFNSKLWEGGVIPKFTDGILSISAENSLVTLELVNAEATAVILNEDLKLKYRGIKLTIERLTLKPATHDLKITLTGIPPDYDEDMGSFLKFSLNEILWESGVLRRGEEGALHIHEEGTNKLVLQFLNDKCVKHLLLVETMTFLESTLRFTPYFPSLEEMSIQLDNDLMDEELNDHESKKCSCFVQVSNISSLYNKEDFLKCLQRAMEKANFCDQNDRCIVKLLPFDHAKRSVIVQFSSSEEANLATLLENVTYERKPLKFEKTCITDTSNGMSINETASCIETGNKTSDWDVSSGIAINKTASSAEAGNNTSDWDASSGITINKTASSVETGNKTNDWDASNDDLYLDEKVSLSSEEGLNIFLKVLSRFRDEIPKGGSHDPFLEGLVPIMEEMGVSTNVSDMKNRKALFRERFRKLKQKGKDTHFHYKVACVIFEGANKKLLKGSFFEWREADEAKVVNAAGTGVDEDTKFMDDLTKYSEAASWNNKSELALVQCFLANKEMYDDPIRKPHFWRHISAEMKKQKWVYRWQSCQTKYNTLSTEYRNLCDEENATGGVGALERIPDEATRKIMEVMNEIKQYDVDVNPKVTMSAGVQMMKKVQSDAPQGRTRHPATKRQETRHERKAKSEETQSNAFMLFAKAYALKQGLPLEDLM